MIIRFCLSLVFFLSFNNHIYSFQIIGTMERLNKLEKLVVELKNNSSNNEKIFRIYEEISYLYAKNNNFEEAIYYANEMLKISNELSKKDYKAKSYLKLARYKRKKNRNIESLEFFKLSLEYYLNKNDSLEIAKIYRNIAQIESFFGDYLSSEKNNVKALQYLNKNDLNIKAQIYYNIGIVYKENKLYNEAVKKYELAIGVSKSLKDKIKYLNAKANTYRYLKRYDSAIEIFKKLLDTVNYDKYFKSKARVLDNLAFAKWQKKTKEDVLVQLLEAKLIREEEKDNYGLMASYAHLSDYYEALNKDKSLEYAYDMYRVSKLENNSTNIIEALDKIRKKEKDEIAIKYANVRIRINDSLQSVNKNRQYKYALVKYESEKNEKKAIGNKLLAEQEKNKKNLLGFLGVGILLSSVFYFFYRKKKEEKNKIIEVYKTETRLSKKIHDELANDVYQVMNKVQYKDVSSEDLLTDLDKIYAQTRDISHENSPVMTGEYFENFLKQLFLDFTTNSSKVLHKDLSKIEVNALSKEKQIVLYRLLRELLVNMQKHSKATLVMITFSLEKNTIKVKYKDNGIGAKTTAIKNGLQNMETRIKTIGGSITFETQEQKGFESVFKFKK